MLRLKKILRYLLAENEDYSLEERFYISTLLIGFLMSLIGTISNYFLTDSITAIIIPLSLSASIVCFYYFVRFKGMFKSLAFPIVVFAFIGISFIWLFNGGMNGSNDIVFFIALVLGLTMVDDKKKFYVLIIFILIKSILYYLQLKQHWLIIEYPTEFARWIDLLITSIYSSFIIYLTIKFLHNNYRIEHVKVENSKKELKVLNLELQNSNQTKDLFFSIISHDLKSPFNTILGFSDLIVRNIDKYDKEKIKTLSSNINQVANETLLLLENLLKWSTLQQGILQVNMNKHKLENLVNEIGLLYKEIAKRKEITIKSEVSNEIFVYCDEEMTKTILRNIIANAIKFTETNGFIAISAKENNTFVEIQIRDNGIGIAEDKIEKLFIGDNYISTNGTDNEKGTGLGLNLCKAFIEKQGGNIWTESKLGLGSSFHFTLKKFS